MRCPYCSAKILDNSTFCNVCGQEISLESVNNTNPSTKTREYWNKYRSDTGEEIQKAHRVIEERRAEQKRIKKTRFTCILILLCSSLIIGLFLFTTQVIIPRKQYNDALNLLNSGEFQKAADAFSALGDYKDAEQQIERCNEMIVEEQYLLAVSEYDRGSFFNAFSIFSQLDEYKDSRTYIKACYTGIQKDLRPQYVWDFSVSLSEQNKTQSQTCGDVRIVPIEDGPISYAAYFDGDGDYIECGRGINISDSFTVNVLFCCQDVNKSYSSFFAKYEKHGGPYAFAINKGQVNMWLTDNSGFHKEIVSTTEIKNGEWYYVTLVRQDDNFRLYVNGILEAEETWSNMRQSDDMVTIGRQALMFAPEDQLQYTGYLGHISIFESALSNTEIEAIHSILF